jgi:hypothetical protein
LVNDRAKQAASWLQQPAPASAKSSAIVARSAIAMRRPDNRQSSLFLFSRKQVAECDGCAGELLPAAGRCDHQGTAALRQHVLHASQPCQQVESLCV